MKTIKTTVASSPTKKSKAGLPSSTNEDMIREAVTEKKEKKKSDEERIKRGLQI